MSRYAINRAAWSERDKDEYEDLLAEICNATTDTSERLDLFEDKLTDAVQAQRTWALHVSRACRRAGLGKEIVRFEDRNRALVSYDGQLLSVPRRQGRKVKVAGEVTYQRELIVVWSWDEIAEKREEVIKATRSYTVKVQQYDRLLALRVLAPAAKSPAEAAELLGLDLDEYLGKSEAA
ncbi:hypothetical protein Drose_04555 [Dactylosporangium roseum]|uniref:Uncharacterized protein n=1 Tax=Dactylosporangium roseum TaxID=47989 RepID=A0ABY5Z7J9_9ACTN|nr:hypothetical protein [Dactylosporangium roseum]UWZ37561.1 hypothetical protein Drose_04555 [Dactylosporangium roseum]